MFRIAKRYASGFPSIRDTMLPENYAAREHAAEAVSLWKKINLFLVIPVVAVIGYFVIPAELKHLKHLEEHPNQYVAWPHMRKRKNEFPWGNEALFHNKNSNASPE